MKYNAYSGNQLENMPPIIWWVVWLAMLMGVTIITFALGGGASESPSPDEGPTGSFPIFAVAILVPVILVIIAIRWVLLPRIKTQPLGFVAFLIGMSTSELIAFFGIFGLPEYQWTLFAIAIVAMLQFAPLFAHQRD